MPAINVVAVTDETAVRTFIFPLLVITCFNPQISFLKRHIPKPAEPKPNTAKILHLSDHT